MIPKSVWRFNNHMNCKDWRTVHKNPCSSVFIIFCVSVTMLSVSKNQETDLLQLGANPQSLYLLCLLKTSPLSSVWQESHGFMAFCNISHNYYYAVVYKPWWPSFLCWLFRCSEVLNSGYNPHKTHPVKPLGMFCWSSPATCGDSCSDGKTLLPMQSHRNSEIFEMLCCEVPCNYLYVAWTACKTWLKCQWVLGRRTVLAEKSCSVWSSSLFCSLMGNPPVFHWCHPMGKRPCPVLMSGLLSQPEVWVHSGENMGNRGV